MHRGIHGVVGVMVVVKLVPPKTLERSTGKAERVINEQPNA